MAIVTGANKGIGFAMVKRLAQLGLTMVLIARDIEKGHKTKTKEKYQNQTTTVMIHKYILTLYTLTLAKSTNTIYTKQSTDPYLTFWMCKCAEIVVWVRGGVKEEKTTMSVGVSLLNVCMRPRQKIRSDIETQTWLPRGVLVHHNLKIEFLRLSFTFSKPSL